MKQFYKGFDLISETDIIDYKSKGLYLKHKKTGLEVFHLLNNDEENLFAFAFRTPSVNSTGVAHILEHSVFCGSKKFPLKEPFVNLMNQSVYTFLNAMTYPDKTVYPASSVNKIDYFHLMEVYGDAVFFPLLREETFHQEGYRLEKNDKGVYSLQGVVYNEMKGNYSSFNSVAFDEQFKSLLQNTFYENDSGGDPLVIPSLTYDDFKSFHHKYYSPSNCLLFLYGNIETKEQLDFIQENILDRLEEDYSNENINSNNNFVNQILDFEKSCKIDKEIQIYAKAPDSNVKESNVTINWRYGKSCNIDETMELIFLLQVLAGNDSSPVAKVLSESNLGQRFISGAGADSFLQMIFFGLSGVKKSNINAVKKLIISTLTDLCEKGVSKTDIDAAILSVDFSNREIVRLHGDPFSLVIMDRALNGWNYGVEPSSTICYRNAFDKIKNKIQSDKLYVEKLIKKILLNNNERSFVVVTPSKSFLADRNKKEKKLIAELAKNVDLKKLEQDAIALQKYQQYKETEKDTSCIPHISPKDLKDSVLKLDIEERSCKGCDGSDVPLFISNEETSGIVYINVCYPLDVLSVEDYQYVPTFASCATFTGWKGKSWVECAKEVSLCCGDFNVASIIGSVDKVKFSSHSNNLANYIGRDWISFNIKFPIENASKALSTFSDALTGMEFYDTKRIKNIIDEIRNGVRSSIIHNGSRYASLRSARNLNRERAIDEIWGGLSQVFTLEKLYNSCYKNLENKFSKFADNIRNSGGIIHITADKTSLDKIMLIIPDFVKKIGLHSLDAKIIRDDKEYYSLTNLAGEVGNETKELCLISSQVGYASKALNCGEQSMAENAALEILCHWLGGNILWEKIRMEGGAYGAYASYDIISNIFSMSTYRDPHPDKSLTTFVKCLEDVCKIDFSENDVARAITGFYGEIVRPLSPNARGYLGFKNKLFLRTEEDRNARLKSILNVDKSQIHNVAKKLLDYNCNSQSTIICDKSINTTGFIIDLSL